MLLAHNIQSDEVFDNEIEVTINSSGIFFRNNDFITSSSSNFVNGSQYVDLVTFPVLILSPDILRILIQ